MDVRNRAALAVGIATRDRPAGLARCLEALLAGDRVPDEVVVVDQGSDDRARAVVDRFARDGRPVHHVAQTARGLSASRNAAIAHTSAPVVAFTDDDCVPDAAWAARVAEAFGPADAPDALTGRVLALGPPTPGTHAVSLRTDPRPAEFRRRTVPWHVGTGANIAVARVWLQRVGGFDERLGTGSPGRAAEDADLLDRLLAAGAVVRYEPSAIVYHERLTHQRRLATRSGYGYGIGAVCGLRLRRGDLFALRMMASWGRTLARQAYAAAVAGDRCELHQRWLSARGTAAGLVYGLRCAPAPRLASIAPDGTPAGIDRLA